MFSDGPTGCHSKRRQDRLRTYTQNIKQRSRDYCGRAKAHVLHYTFRRCVCSLKVLSMQSACAVLYCHLCPVCLYHLLHFTNGTIFGLKNKVTEHIRCVLIFSTTSVSNISHSNNSSRHYHKYTVLYVKYPILLSDFNETWIFSTDFRKKQSNVESNEKLSSGSRVDAYRHDVNC